MDLTDSVAVVTGASSGVGEATARRLADEGCRVALVARREERLEALADDLGRERALPVPTDVTDTDAVEAMVEAVVEEFGAVDVLVNNAGVLFGDPVAESDPADFDDLLDVNLRGAMYVTRAALPHVLDGGGHVLTVSSMNAQYPAAGASAYTASKYGVNGFCDSLRREMSDEDVRVTVVMPGPIQSEMKDWSDWDGRPLQPADVADTIAFAATRPPHVEIPDLTVNTTDKLG
jgi:NADP-dependent 3-hydroxy acid dehydrogenase YdfG